METRIKPSNKPIWKPKSLIAGYIEGKVKLEELMPKNRIIKPEDRPNKDAFLPQLNDDFRMFPRKRAPKAIHRTVASQSIKPLPQTDPRSLKTHILNIDLDNMNPCYVVVNNTSSKPRLQNTLQGSTSKKYVESKPQLNTLQYHKRSIENDSTSDAKTQTHPDRTYYEDVVNAKNNEIQMLKEKVRNMQKNLISVPSTDATDKGEKGDIDALLASLTQVSSTMSRVKNSGDTAIKNFIDQVEVELDKCYSLMVKISETMKMLKSANANLTAQHSTVSKQLREKSEENQTLLSRISNLDMETEYLKAQNIENAKRLEKLKALCDENDKLTHQLAYHRHIQSLARNELHLLDTTSKKLSQEIDTKMRQFNETEVQLNKHIEELSDTLNQRPQVSSDDDDGKIVEAVRKKFEDEREAVRSANEKYISQLHTQTVRLQEQVASFKREIRQLNEENEKYYMLAEKLTNENSTLRECGAYVENKESQLKEAIGEWMKNDACTEDSIGLIDLISKLKIKAIDTEKNYSNMLLQNLDDAVRLTMSLNSEINLV